MRVEACEATRIRGEQSEQLLDLRMACLDARRRDLRAFAAVLREADGDVVDKAIVAARALEPLAVCADTRSLTARVAPPRPAVRARVDAVHESLSRVRALYESGKYGAGLEPARAAFTAAGEIGYEPLTAEAGYWLGELHKGAGEYEPARAGLEDAAWLAEKIGDDAVRAEALTSEVEVLTSLSRLDEAERAGRQAEAIIARIGDQGLLRVRWLGLVGWVYFIRRDHERALDYLGRALSTGDKVLGPDHPQVARDLGRLGTAYWAKGDSASAEKYLLRSLDTWERAVGADHPLMIPTLTNLGIVYGDRDDNVRAQATFVRAVTVAEKALGPEHPQTATALTNLGELYLLRGDHARARDVFARVRGLFEKSLGPNHPNVASAIVGEADCDQALKHYDLAIAEYERGLQICDREVCTPDTVVVAPFGLAQTLWKSGRDHQRAVQLAEGSRELYLVKLPQRKAEREEVETWLKGHHAK
jgi:tetratricopeptide (TPR) repeat protein